VEQKKALSSFKIDLEASSAERVSENDRDARTYSVIMVTWRAARPPASTADTDSLSDSTPAAAARGSRDKFSDALNSTPRPVSPLLEETRDRLESPTARGRILTVVVVVVAAAVMFQSLQARYYTLQFVTEIQRRPVREVTIEELERYEHSEEPLILTGEFCLRIPAHPELTLIL